MKYFSIRELSHSDTAKRTGIKNEPDEEVKENLTYLVDNLLDPLRELYGKPVIITSGYRCEELNRFLKGVKTSFHLTGCAADIDVGDNSDNKVIFDLIKDNLPFTELGWEGGGKWVHVALKKGRDNEKEIFCA